MATKKKATQTGDDKSQQLAAAAVDQSAELVQAQAEPLQSVALEQAAEAQGVDLVAANLATSNQVSEQPLEEEVDISDSYVRVSAESPASMSGPSAPNSGGINTAGAGTEG